ncbi:helix-turn-helix transcriptional regulator [Labedella endophytica]|uniref:WYL domain-containing transcriptional regulator n=1 Tax=Labedella endophytica TaxID=1523160 RepID=A0A3S0XQA5_9MICO|nr:WYL domain-containing protein [Labedella endophytica]RUR03124.1 WYL domain-containing transcriptional regulator [Labedella endophytica]
MPVSDSPSTSRRLLALLSLLQARRDWPAPALARRLDVSERTVRRDIERLRDLDYTIDSTRGPDGGYRLQAGSQLPPLVFDDEQAVAIALALRTASSLGVDMEEAAARALGTVTRLMPSRLANRIENLEAASSGDRGRVVVDPGVLLRIGEAIRVGEELRFDYASPGSDPVGEDAPAPRRNEPHHLLLHAGRWYLIGYSPEKAEWRIYRVDRITPRSHSGRRFEPRTVPGGDPARFLAARFKGSTGADTWACWGEATLDVPLAAVAPYLADGSAEALAANRCRVRLGSWSWGSLAAAFLRFEADVAEAEPAALRAAFATLAERARSASRP